MKYFDAHTHVNFVAFNEDREASSLCAKGARDMRKDSGRHLGKQKARESISEKAELP